MVKPEPKSKYHRCDQGCSISKRKLFRRPSTHDLINRKLPEACICEIFRRLWNPQDLRSCAAVCWGWAGLMLSLSPSLLWNCEDSVVLSGRNVDDTSLVTEVINVSYEMNSVTDLCVSGWSPSSTSRSGATRAGGVPMVTDRGIKFAAMACWNLKSVRLQDCPLLTDRSMDAIAASCSALEALYLCGNSSVTDDGVTEVSKGCASLSCIHIEDCPSVTSASLRAMAEHAKKLTTVSLRRCPRIPSNAVVSLMAERPDLVAVKLECMSSVPMQIAESDASFPAAACDESSGMMIRCLQSLILIDCDGLDGLFAHVQLPMVKRVVIQGCTGLDHHLDLIYLLGPSTALETLELGMFSFSSYANLMGVISLCHGTIKHLVMEHCSIYEASSLSPPPLSSWPAGEEVVPERCPNLELIKLHNCGSIADMLLPWISAACHEVKELSLIGMSSTTDGEASNWDQGGGGVTISEHLYAVAHHCSRITKLDLSRSGAHDVFVRVAVSLLGNTLQELVLDGSPRFEGHYGASIAEHCRGLVRLSLSGTRVVDGTLKLMVSRGFEYLRELVLERCHGLTDEALEVLFSSRSRLRRLQRLNVRGCRGITPHAVVMYETVWRIKY